MDARTGKHLCAHTGVVAIPMVMSCTRSAWPSGSRRARVGRSVRVAGAHLFLPGSHRSYAGPRLVSVALSSGRDDLAKKVSYHVVGYNGPSYQPMVRFAGMLGPTPF